MYVYTVIFIAFAITITSLAAIPIDEVIPIVSQSQDGPNPDGSYKYSYESGNGIKAQEEGQLTNVGSEKEAMNAVGEYSYKSDDGQEISVKYQANEDGFQPQGSHIPTAPPIPPLIQKALDWIAANPSKDDKDNA